MGRKECRAARVPDRKGLGKRVWCGKVPDREDAGPEGCRTGRMRPGGCDREGSVSGGKRQCPFEHLVTPGLQPFGRRQHLDIEAHTDGLGRSPVRIEDADS